MELPAHACRYCGIHDPACVVKVGETCTHTYVYICAYICIYIYAEERMEQMAEDMHTHTYICICTTYILISRTHINKWISASSRASGSATAAGTPRVRFCLFEGIGLAL